MMKYIEGVIYGKSKEYIEGYKAGLYAFAIWKDGKQIVGSGNTELKDIYKIINNYLRKTE